MSEAHTGTNDVSQGENWQYGSHRLSWALDPWHEVGDVMERIYNLP